MDNKNIEEILETLESVSKKYDDDSLESHAIAKASESIIELQKLISESEFIDFINRKDMPFTGFMLLHLKICGIDIPELRRTPEVIELEKDIEKFSKRFMALKQYPIYDSDYR